jgi:hypothetical protein
MVCKVGEVLVLVLETGVICTITISRFTIPGRLSTGTYIDYRYCGFKGVLGIPVPGRDITSDELRDLSLESGVVDYSTITEFKSYTEAYCNVETLLAASRCSRSHHSSLVIQYDRAH